MLREMIYNTLGPKCLTFEFQNRIPVTFVYIPTVFDGSPLATEFMRKN